MEPLKILTAAKKSRRKELGQELLKLQKGLEKTKGLFDKKKAAYEKAKKVRHRLLWAPAPPPWQLLWSLRALP